jgi:radical SAM superfamily enzyme YgiQ (UPF0313 family)
MDIVLAVINAKWIHPSLALRLLKANLGGLGDRSEIMEFSLRQNLEEKTNPILAARPRILGLSVSMWNHRATLELLEALEEKWARGQKPFVVLGGPEVSWLPGDAEIFRYADFVIRGEGEESFRLLCHELLYSPESANQKILTGSKFLSRGDTMVALDKAAYAYGLYTDEDIQKKLIYVESSRGCPFGCEFCLSGSEKQEVREFPLETFLPEMGTLIDRGVRTFKFLDRTFNLDIKRAAGIMEFFLGRIETKGSRPFCVHLEMVPSRFPPELRELIRRFPPGTLRLELGIQTFNRKTAELVHRSWDAEGSALETLKFLREKTNAILHVDLIAGLPDEDFASFGAGFDLLWRTLSPSTARPESSFEIQPGILKCLPGTPISRHNGMKFSPDPPYEVLETPVLSAAGLDRIKNFARFWEIIVNRNAFPDFIPFIVPSGEAVFGKFMNISDKLLARFGKNWGIDRGELRLFLNSLFPPKDRP